MTIEEELLFEARTAAEERQEERLEDRRNPADHVFFEGWQ